ncbi:hypothetical protein ENKNEFLB_03962 [Nocardioides aquaticus]|uniref:Uncharacterized protein n=1 Tax=Nocardioides aquaticus TaxID=160826 RepID=A0ABX8EM08_9ACTN|nr:hypothetical protein [Nocardioides aquaticus]QVT81552.1 hypothetical protein ENKNEFLB_03962 [Nocardioides aquaticus]
MSDAKTGQPGEDELVASNPNATGPDGAAGDMGVSSEREGATGPGQHGTDGMLDTSPSPGAPDEETPREQSAGEHDDLNPEAPIPPVAGYNSRDPRSDETPYEPGPSYER